MAQRQLGRKAKSRKRVKSGLRQWARLAWHSGADKPWRRRDCLPTTQTVRRGCKQVRIRVMCGIVGIIAAGGLAREPEPRESRATNV